MKSYPPNPSELLEKRGEAINFGTFGELLQGALPQESTDFLVTFPIQLYARAIFSIGLRDASLSVKPLVKQKSLKLARLMLEHYGLPCRGRLEIVSEIPEGKGLASSSADLVATAKAVATCHEIPMSYCEMERFLRLIEPSDGVMYPGIVAFYHQRVMLKEFLGQLPPLTVLSIDEGGMIDTMEFNRIAKGYREEEKQEFLVLLRAIKECIQGGDLARLGRITTRSAIINQRLNPKKTLARLIEISREASALGVVTTHSGTCIGVLLACDDQAYQTKLDELIKRIRMLCYPIELFESWRPQVGEHDGWSMSGDSLLSGSR